MASETKISAFKVKSSSQDGPSRAKIDSSAIKRKLDSSSSSKQSADSKLKSVKVTKSEVKSKSISSSAKTTRKTNTSKVREKKVYSLPGQKHDPPEEKEPLRIFYESLSKQIPKSEMAEFWLMEHGLLSPERAKRAFENKQRKQKELRTGTPVKPIKPPSKPEASKKQQLASSRNGDLKAKKRIVNDSDDDDDFIFSPKRRKG